MKHTPLLATLILTSSLVTPALANPEGGNVVGGSATITQTGNKLDIHQSSDRLVVDWRSFDIAPNEHTQFYQPSSDSIALNRINSVDPSHIQGKLSANGNIILVNPNGVVIGQGASVDVNGLIATTADINTDDFMDGGNDFNITGNPDAKIINNGTITAKESGLVGLVAPHVENNGIIEAKMGRVHLASGDKVVADFYGDGLLSVSLENEDVKSQQVINTGKITAQGGTVAMTAAQARQTINSLVSAKGEIKVASVSQKGGKIIIGAASGKTEVSGKLNANGKTGGGEILIGGDYQGVGDMPTSSSTIIHETAEITANATNSGDGGKIIAWADHHTQMDGTIEAKGGINGGDGGFVETSGKETLSVGDTAYVSTLAEHGENGTWLLDPQDFTIGDGGDMSAATLQTALTGGNVSILSSSGGTSGNGDINVNDAVSWSSNRLTLTAARDINVNDVMTATGTAALTFNTGTANGGDAGNADGALNMALDDTGFTGRVDYSASGSLIINGNTYTVINSLGAEGSMTGTDLQGMAGNLSGYYVLGSNIDASATSGWNAGAGFDPIGYYTGRFGPNDPFTGKLEGLGHTVSNLTINRAAESYTGLIGYSDGAKISNIGIVDTNITGRIYTGALVGLSLSSETINSYATGNVTGNGATGGLIGRTSVGGISSRVQNSYANVNVTGTYVDYGAYVLGGNYIGGLIGDASGGIYINNHATGDVNGYSIVGGIFGDVWYASSMENNYATGNVNGTSSVGGFSGRVYNSTIQNNYATGGVSGTTNIGGFSGYTDDGNISYSYSTGSVTGTTNVGGFLGNTLGISTITSSYWNTQTSGQATSAGGTGLTTAQMKQMSSYVGWDIANNGGSNAVWRIYEGSTTPLLRSFLTPMTMSTGSGSIVSDGTPWSGGFGITSAGYINGDDISDLSGSLRWGGSAQGAFHPGQYSVTPTGYYSHQQGYDIEAISGTLTISRISRSVPSTWEIPSYKGKIADTTNANTKTSVTPIQNAGIIYVIKDQQAPHANESFSETPDQNITAQTQSNLFVVVDSSLADYLGLTQDKMNQLFR